MTFHRYVALGDSFTEGVGDHDPDRPNGVRGWADRVAEALAAGTSGLGYANLAIRGRKLDAIVAEQVPPALTLQPDLVSVYAGGNDILRPRVDVDALVARYDEALGRLTADGAHLVLFTGSTSASRRCSGIFAAVSRSTTSSSARSPTDLGRPWSTSGGCGTTATRGCWDVDRLHMSSAGHQRMAVAVLDALGVEHDLMPYELADLPEMDRRQRRAADLAWMRSHAAPWVQRRLRGTSSGDGLSPRYPELVDPAAPRHRPGGGRSRQ